MNILNYTQTLNNQTIATIGFFDGVHTGHQFLLSKLQTLSQASAMDSLVVSFNNSPQKVLHPKRTTKILTTPTEKTTLLTQIGISHCLMLDFDMTIAKLCANDFLQNLKQNFGVQKLLIGYDHRFGSDAMASFEDYQKLGSELGVEIIQCPRFDNNGIQVSSSKIRLCISEGDIETANRLLGYNYTITGKVVHGNKIGRKIGIPTANIEPNIDKLIPKNGVYIVKTTIDKHTYKGLLNIGIRPTIDDGNKTIETHLIDFNGNLYGQTIALQIEKRLRSEKKFASLEALQQQIETDKNLLRST